MFRSGRRSVVFPQAEHARLAGTLALVWGNERFAAPSLPPGALVQAATLHDRGYGPLDADGIGEVDDDRWLAIQRAGFAPRGDDPVVDLLVALHVRRLVAGRGGPAGAATAATFDAALPDLHAAAGVDAATAAEADRIVDLCDRVAFDFCLEQPRRGVVDVACAPGARPVPVSYALDGSGLIVLDPWPLAVARLDGIALGFAAERYPDDLDAVAVPFQVRPDVP